MNKKIYLILIFLFFSQTLFASISIDSNLQVDGNPHTQKTNNKNPELVASVNTSDSKLSIKPYAFNKITNVLYLWHFDEVPEGKLNVNDVLQEVDNDSANNFILEKTSITVTGSDNSNFGKNLYSYETKEYILKNTNLLKTALPTGTIEFWFKPKNNISGLLTTEQYFIYKGTNGTEYFLTIKLNLSGQLEWTNYNGSSEETLSSVQDNWDSDTWYYIACVFTNTSKKLYINGVLDKSDTNNGAITTNSTDLLVCGRGVGANDSFQGYFDELRISNDAFDEDQIFADYNNGAYKTSTDNGSNWSDWKTLEIQENTKRLLVSTDTLNFPSSYTDNKVKFIAKNSSSEYATEEFLIKVDTITPNNVSDFETLDPSVEKRITLRWKATDDNPDNEDITKYEVKASSASPSDFATFTDWLNQASDVSGLPTPEAKPTTQTFDYDSTLKETTYYFSIRTYDGVNYSDYSEPAISGITGGLNDITNFTGEGTSDTTILWQWTDNSMQEDYFDIYDKNYNIVVSNLSADTTHYYENNLKAGIDYIRHIKARNSNFETNYSSYTANTLGKYKKDIDNDNEVEYFSDTNNTLTDKKGTKVSKLNKSNSKKVFFYIKDRGDSSTSYNPTNVWVIDDDYVTGVKLDDVNGDGESDYLYKSKGSNEYDRFFNPNQDLDTDFGSIELIIYDQNDNLINDANIIIYASSKNVSGISNNIGKFNTSLPITHGLESKVIIEKEGYKTYEGYFDFVNGQINTQTVELFSYAVDIEKDDIHNYPNPFSKNSSTKFVFNIKNDSNIKIYILNPKGRIEKKIFDGYKNSGIYEIEWDGKTDGGSQLDKGIYYILFKTDTSKLVKKVVIK
jgi:hypothetical protein